MWSLKGVVREFGYGGRGERKKKMKMKKKKKKNIERSERMRDLETE